MMTLVSLLNNNIFQLAHGYDDNHECVKCRFNSIINNTNWVDNRYNYGSYMVITKFGHFS